MRIAFIIPSLANTGPVNVVKDLAFYLVGKIDRVEVFYFDDKKEVEFPCPTSKLSLSRWNKLLTNFDVVHSHGLRPDFYIFLNRKRIKGVCISTMHNYMSEDLAYTYNKFIAFFFTKIWLSILKRHDYIVTLTQHMFKWYQKKLPATMIGYVYNSRNLAVYELETINNADKQAIEKLKDQGSILVGAFCALTKRKGIHHLLNAARNDSRLLLIIIGEGKEKLHLIRKAHDYDIINRCLFLGYRKNAWKYFSEIDVYAMTSASEGFPLVVLEAAMMKKPLVCPDSDIFRELFPEDVVSFFDLKKSSGLINAIDRSFKARDLLGGKLNEYVLSHYNLNAMGEGYMRIYKNLLNE